MSKQWWSGLAVLAVGAAVVGGFASSEEAVSVVAPSGTTVDVGAPGQVAGTMRGV